MNGRKLGAKRMELVREAKRRARTLTVNKLGQIHTHRTHRLTDGYIQDLLMALTSAVRRGDNQRIAVPRSEVIPLTLRELLGILGKRHREGIATRGICDDLRRDILDLAAVAIVDTQLSEAPERDGAAERVAHTGIRYGATTERTHRARDGERATILIGGLGHINGELCPLALILKDSELTAELRRELLIALRCRTSADTIVTRETILRQGDAGREAPEGIRLDLELLHLLIRRIDDLEREGLRSCYTSILGVHTHLGVHPIDMSRLPRAIGGAIGGHIALVGIET